MRFMDAYKRLEKLCGDVLGDDRKVSAYIEEMIDLPRGSAVVPGWENDLKQLKHYRWVRNQIVHDPDCTEEDMCGPGDTEWVIGFYNRILDQTDPLTLYRKATLRRPSKPVYEPKCAPYERPYASPSPAYKPTYRQEPVVRKRSSGQGLERAITACCVILVTMIIVLLGIVFWRWL